MVNSTDREAWGRSTRPESDGIMDVYHRLVTRPWSVLMLMVVAAFSIVSTLVVMIMEKKPMPVIMGS